MASNKILPLEALRGLAASLVVSSHFVLAFLPYYVHLVPDSAALEGRFIGTPLYLLANGRGMVVIFFALSGYVLALKGLRPNARTNLAETAIKRWFRFTPLISVTLLISYLLFSLDLYHFHDASGMSGSLWLDSRAFPGLTQAEKPAFLSVLQDALYGALLLDEYKYDAALWTMSIEFWGSLMVLATALLLAPKKRIWFIVIIPIVYMFTAPISANSILFSCFFMGPLGVMLRLGERSLGKVQAICMLVTGLYFCGYYYPQGWYGWIATLPLPEKELRTLILSLGGFLMLCMFATHNCISARFSGRISRFLGIISFPLYLLHILVITSFSSWAYISAGGGDIAIALAGLVLIGIVLPLSWLLGTLDHWWLRKLGIWHPLSKKTASGE